MGRSESAHTGTWWKNLLDDEDADLDSAGLELSDHCGTVQNIGGEEGAEEDVLRWLEEGEGDPGHHIPTEGEMADEVMTLGDEGGSEGNEEEETTRLYLFS